MTTILLDHARLFCAIDETVVADGAVLIKDGTILAAGESIEVNQHTEAASAIHRNLSGKFLMPGMTETHAHLSFADESPFAIGATSVEDATIVAVRNAQKMLKMM